MTVSEWIKENKKRHMYSELTIVDRNNHIILDDRLAYLPARSKDYNSNWRRQCRGKQIIRTWDQPRGGIVLQIDTIKEPY